MLSIVTLLDFLCLIAGQIGTQIIGRNMRDPFSNFLRHGLQSPFRMVCGNFILPEACKPCLFLSSIQFAQLILPYPALMST